MAEKRKSILMGISFLFLGLCVAPGIAAETDKNKENDGFTRGDEVKVFDGKSLKNWRVIDIFDFKDHGKVSVKEGVFRLEKGVFGTGISYKKKIPRSNYELTLEGRRSDGDDFFCGLTFPVKKDYCTLILGGWGGSLVGLSNIDDFSAAENETTTVVEFKNNQWYKIRLRVTDEFIRVWIDDEKTIDAETDGRKFSIWWEQEPITPLGIATWKTTGEIRKLKLYKLKRQEKEQQASDNEKSE